MEYPKRLIEVDLPIKRISAHARREKSIRHGHISTLHIWWARRPLAACRAVICASLWPDPADPLCPQSFRDSAAAVLTRFAGSVYHKAALHGSASVESFGQWEGIVEAAKQGLSFDTTDPAHLNKLRFALLDFIADFANWDNSTVAEYLEASRALTQSAHEALGGAPGTRPLVVDPFAGGGSIPLEALRVGADAFASDLNPIPVLLNKVVLEYIPKYGQRLADEVRKWGAWIKDEAEKELAEFYPKDADGATPIAYLWARTIRCEGPGCGAEVPLIKSLWLGKKPHNSWSISLIPDRDNRRVIFKVIQGAKPNEVGEGTIKRGSATCPCCGYTTPASSMRKQMLARNGGASDSCLYCVATTKPSEKGRFYRIASSHDVETAKRAQEKLEQSKHHHNGLSNIPTEPTPMGGGKGAGRAFSQRNYGMNEFKDLFTPRQILTLLTLIDKLKYVRKEFGKNHTVEFADAVQSTLALNINKMAEYGSSLASWSSHATKETIRGTFSRQALSIIWDFAESYPFAESSGGWTHNLNFLTSPLEAESQTSITQGQIERASATNHPLPNDFADSFITDPPYYDAIPYADLSDFFIVWLKRSLLGTKMAERFASLSPKDDECVVDEVKGHDSAFFVRTMAKALEEGRRITRPGGIGIVVFAHKSTQGWESQLQAMIDAGWVVTGSWPIDTERVGRVRANSSAALASSVHLVCRPREHPDGSVRTDEIGDWRDVLQELPRRIHEWMPRLADEGVVGADAIFACLGPALEVFSRHSRVEKANGEAVSLKEYLVEVWAAVSNEALSLIFKDADSGGLEPDARLTAMWLWTLSASGTDSGGGAASEEDAEEDSSDDDDESAANATKGQGFTLEFDAARKIAQGLGAHLEVLQTVVEIKGKTARLLSVSERAKHLFGKEVGQTAPAPRKSRNRAGFLKGMEDASSPIPASASGDEIGPPRTGATVLDRVHQAMILFGTGRSEALKTFVTEGGAGTDPRFWKLAQSFSALYPTGTEEKRWVDGVLSRKKGLGF